MTLMEALVALSVLALMLSVAMPSLGPWLGQSRRVEREAAFWRDVAASQTTLAELALAARDPAPRGAGLRFLTAAPRLAPELIPAEILIAGDAHDTLLLRWPRLRERETILLAGGPPLRLRPLSADRAIVVEAELKRGWTPVLVAPIGADAPRACTFDFDAGACR